MRDCTEVSDEYGVKLIPLPGDHIGRVQFIPLLKDRIGSVYCEKEMRDCTEETEKEMRDCTEVSDEYGVKFIPLLEDHIDDYKSELWSALYSPQISALPKKGDLVVYNPQGHLNYKYSNMYNCPPPKEPGAYGLQPQIICRVEHVQLFITELGDDICSYITLHPEPEVNSEEKKLEQSDEIEGWIWDAVGSATKSTRMLSKIVRYHRTDPMLYIPHAVATEFFHSDMVERVGGFIAKDFLGFKWIIPYDRGLVSGYCSIDLKALYLDRQNMQIFRIVFFRDKDTKLRFAIRRYDDGPVNNFFSVDNRYAWETNTFCAVARAISNKSTFSVTFIPSFKEPEFLIPYQKYMRSIIWSQQPPIGTRLRRSTGIFIERATNKLCPCIILPDIIICHSEVRCPKRHSDIGVVTGMRNLDSLKWPNSKWKCLTVSWQNERIGTYNSSISPWEIVLDHPNVPDSSTVDSLSKLKIPLTSQQDNSPPMSHLEKDNYLLSDEAIGLEKQTAEPQTSSQLPPTHPFDIEKQTSESQTSSQLLPTHPLDGYTTNHPFDIEKQTPELQTSIEKQTPEPQTSSQLPPTHPFDIEKQTSGSQTSSQLLPTHPLDGYTTNHPFDNEKQTPEPQTSSQLTPFTDSCSLTSSKSKSTTYDKELKLCNCSVDDFWHHVKGNCSLEYLEFDSCLFSLAACYPLPTTLKKLKITNCVDAEHVFSVLRGPNIESLEIYSCSSFRSMPTGGIPATLRQLKIVNCGNLKSLREAFMTKTCSTFERFYCKAGTLELRKLEIENCRELEFLPQGLHELRNLDILSIKNCDSIRYFPSDGLPRTCLTSLSISGCHHLKCLPNQLDEVTSLLNLTICGCPYLMNFPEGGLPRSLVSLSISKCQNFIPICNWGLHHLEHLERYSFRGGCLDT